ncbi:SEC24-related protein [Naegleria gruberi]|uniref:SEC24-related protein n=1 Tax=Naegleria gruberi TaxID=5762 RepID=D2VIE0_NAEGR|nr:SEC24-related protein [Naegleria gruberi]EFC43343.1 SEC24-related protein [Naegleria gruberi]|eukprot:XP_002676087.1 SEC24-related protein [Naegleria gruberi strain NEG-M]
MSQQFFMPNTALNQQQQPPQQPSSSTMGGGDNNGGFGQQQQGFYNPQQQQATESPTVGGFFNPQQQQQGFYNPMMNQQQQQQSTQGFYNPMMMGSNTTTTPPPTMNIPHQQQQQFFNPMMNNPSTPTSMMGTTNTTTAALPPPPTSLSFDPRDSTGQTSATSAHPHVSSFSTPLVQQQQGFMQQQQVSSNSGFSTTNSMIPDQSTTTPTTQNTPNNLGVPKKVQKASSMPTPAILPLKEHTTMHEYETASFLEHYMLTNSMNSPVTSLGSSSTLNNFALGGQSQQMNNNNNNTNNNGGGVLSGLFGSSSPNLPFNTNAIQQGPNTSNITPYFNVPPPPADRRMKIICRGSCTPHRIRPTLYCVPNTKKLLDASQLMMGAIVQPMANLNPQDQPNHTPIVDFTNYEILRCSRCRAYMNPFMKFVDNGKKYQCNFCGFSNNTPDWYYCPTDVYGVRTDILQRPELSVGDVDFIATQQYNSKAREPKPQTFVYVIDVGHDAIESGLLRSVIEGLKTCFKTFGPKFRNSNVVFITFAKNIQFYNFRKSNNNTINSNNNNNIGNNGNNNNNNTSEIKHVHPQVMIVADLQNSFVPIHQEASITFGDIIYGSSTSSEHVNHEQVDEFFNRFYETASKLGERSNDNVAGSAMKCAEELLSESGGRVLLFTSKIPTLGQGNFTLGPNASESDQERRNPYKLYGTDREKEIFIPELGFWKNLGISCAKKAIGIDIFLFPKTYIETANLSSAAQTTGGHVYLYHQFSVKRDEERLILDLNRHLERESGYDAIFKIRTSSGIGIRRYFGHFLQQQDEVMDLAVIDSDTSFGVEFKHDESNLLGASESGNHYIQCALVYTNSSDGKRYLRVQTLKLKTATDFNTLYRRSDIGACLALYSRLFVHQVIQNRDTLDTVRDMICDRLTNLLACLAKSPAFCRYTRVSLDKKIHSFHLLMKFSCAQAINYCYPRLYEIQNLTFNDEVHDQEDNEQDEIIPISYNSDGSRYPMPPILPPSSSIVSSDGIYLMSDGNECLFWIGKDAPQDRIQELFGVDSIDQITLSTSKPVFSMLENLNVDDLSIPNAPYSSKVQFIVKELISRGVQHGGIYIYKESNEGTDGSFFIRMVEDKFGSGISSSPVDKSYSDFLVILHNEVKKLM